MKSMILKLLFCASYLSIATVAYSEILEFNEKIVGQCIKFYFDTETGEALLIEIHDMGCADPHYIKDLAGPKFKVFVLVPETEPGFQGYDYWWPTASSVELSGAQAFAGFYLSPSQYKTLNHAIDNHLSFNIGLTNGERWAGSFFQCAARTLSNTPATHLTVCSE